MLMFGAPKKQPQPAAAAEPEITDSGDYVDPVILWRAEGLLARGFAIEDTLRMVHNQDVLHSVDALLERGCSITFIVDYFTE